MPRRLTEKQVRFITEVVEDPTDHTEAARRAGYKHPNVQSAQLMNRPRVAAEIERRLRLKRKDCGIDSMVAIENLAEVAMFDPIELVNDDGSPRDLRELPEHVRRAVRKIEFRKEYGANGVLIRREVVATEVCGKLKAWEQIAKLLGLNREKAGNINVNIGDQQTNNVSAVVMSDAEINTAAIAIIRAAQRGGGGSRLGIEQRLATVGGGVADEASKEQSPGSSGSILDTPGDATSSGGDIPGPVAEECPPVPDGPDSPFMLPPIREDDHLRRSGVEEGTT